MMTGWIKVTYQSDETVYLCVDHIVGLCDGAKLKAGTIIFLVHRGTCCVKENVKEVLRKIQLARPVRS